MLFAETITGLSSLKLPMQNIERVKIVQHAMVFQSKKTCRLLLFLILVIRDSNKKRKWLKMVLFPCVKYHN